MANATPRVVLLSKPYRLSRVLEERLAATGCLVGVVHEQRVRSLGDFHRFVSAFARRVGLMRALDVLLYQAYQRIFRRRAMRAAERTITSGRAQTATSDIPHFRFLNLNEQAARDAIRRLDPDVLIVHATGILKPETFGLARRFALNLHCGVLPQYRGHDSTFWALYERDVDRLGATLHVIEAGVDTGQVVGQVRVDWTPNDSDITTWFRAFSGGADLAADVVTRMKRGEALGLLPPEKAHGPHYRRRGMSDHVRYVLRRRARRGARSDGPADRRSRTVVSGPVPWNATLDAFGDHDPRQGYEWGEVRRAAGWTPHRVFVSDAGVPLAAASILGRRVPGLDASILYAPRGPLIDFKDDAAWAALRDALQGLAWKTNAIFLRVSPPVPHTDHTALEALARHGFRPIGADSTVWNIPRVVMTLDLIGSEDALWRRLRPRFRDYVRATSRHGLSVRPATSIDDVRAFHAAMVNRADARTYPIREFSYFELLWRTYMSARKGILLVGEHDGEVTGGLLGVVSGRRACLLYASTRARNPRERRHQGPQLYWAFIHWAKAAGCAVIDWGGSGTQYPPKPGDPGLGLLQFKRGFGSTLEYMAPYHDLVFRPGLYRAFRLAERAVLPLLWDLSSLRIRPERSRV